MRGRRPIPMNLHDRLGGRDPKDFLAILSGQRNHKRRRCPFPAGLDKLRAISIYLKVYPRPSRQALIARK